jgi:OmpA-OmpF porin, OOP family
VSTKSWLILAVLALLLVFIICPWKHWQEIAAMQGGGTSVPAANTNTNANANAPLAAPSFKIAFEGGKYRLTGTLPNEEAKKQVIAEAAKTYGADGFIDELKVGGVSNPSWLSSAIALIPFTKNGVTNGGLSAEGNSLTLRGEVPTAADKDKIYADAVKALPNVTITNALTVAGQKALSDEQVKVQSKLNEQLAGKIVEFETASDQLTDKGKAVLDEIAPILQSSTDKLEVGGHTDNAGNAARNQSLSQRRADTVKKYLVGKNLDTNRFTTKGYGQTKPIAGTIDKQTDEERSRNRRIEFQVLGGEK